MSPTSQFAVCDTNTLVSAALIPDCVPAQAVAKLQRAGRLFFSVDTLEELHAVLRRPKFTKRLPAEDRAAFLDLVTGQADLIEVSTHITACRDPRDDKFLSLALAAGASHLITGDADLLALHPFRTLQILTPRDFLAI